MSTDLQVAEEQTQLNTIEPSRMSSLSIMTNEAHMENVYKIAKLMASSKVTVPKHLQNNEGDCAAVVMQAMNWGMDPFVVAQKTHLVNNTLGYEAQLVNAVVTSSKAISSPFSYEYKDEAGQGANMSVSCRVGAVIRGQQEVTWGEWLNSNSVTTKNSPLWKTNVKQQMSYLQVKNWARLYAPSAILGVYTYDELQDTPIKDLNDAPKSRKGADVARESQNQGVVIDAEQEERRSGLITALEAFAKKGSAVFTDQWRAMGRKNRNDALLVGEPEYLRLLGIAQAVDVEVQQPDVTDDQFVAEMNQAEAAQ